MHGYTAFAAFLPMLHVLQSFLRFLSSPENLRRVQQVHRLVCSLSSCLMTHQLKHRVVVDSIECNACSEACSCFPVVKKLLPPRLSERKPHILWQQFAWLDTVEEGDDMQISEVSTHKGSHEDSRHKLPFPLYG